MDTKTNNTDQLIEADIVRTLESIGFPASPQVWREAAPAIDPDGQTLRLLGHPVMERWEEPYMQKLAALATAKAVGGTVLELGFGMGISARFIQQHAPAHHVIIEMNKAIAETARAFARQQANPVTILEGTWQEIAPLLAGACYQGILFDTYPTSEADIFRTFTPFLAQAHRLLAPGGVLTYFSDEATWFSAEHLAALRAAGFSKINGELVPVTPPPDCLYWRQPTILAPVIEK
ncbi:MAG: class I SAM-dependent methyltransferase [Acidobacteria bacterium]|nr:class I SAM-dependent methyltransferase [Acidobacteriota bacterium]